MFLTDLETFLTHVAQSRQLARPKRRVRCASETSSEVCAGWGAGTASRAGAAPPLAAGQHRPGDRAALRRLSRRPRDMK